MRLRPARDPDDLEQLAAFRCTAYTRRYAVQDIERDVRSGKVLRGLRHTRAHRFLLLVDNSDELLGCSYHEPWHDHPMARARFLRFIALADQWQGKMLDTGYRASERLLIGTLDDIRTMDPLAEIAVGNVHPSNERSIRLLRSTQWQRYMAVTRRLDQYYALL